MAPVRGASPAPTRGAFTEADCLDSNFECDRAASETSALQKLLPKVTTNLESTQPRVAAALKSGLSDAFNKVPEQEKERPTFAKILGPYTGLNMLRDQIARPQQRILNAKPSHVFLTTEAYQEGIST